MSLERSSFWACSCYGLDKIGWAMQRRRRLVDIARLLELFLTMSSLWCSAETVYVFRFTDKMNVSPLWCIHLVVYDLQQLSYYRLLQQTICVTSLWMFSSLWCGWFQEGETSGSLWSSTALIFSIISTDDTCHLSMYSADDFRKRKTSGSLWSSTALIFSIISTDDTCHLSMYFLFSLVQMISGRGNIWQPVILNSSHTLNYFKRRYVSPLYVCSLLSGADDFRKGKHLAACDPQQLSYSQLFQQTICVTSLCIFSSLWCGWCPEGETSGSLWSSTALIMLMTAQPVIRTPTWDLPVPLSSKLLHLKSNSLGDGISFGLNLSFNATKNLLTQTFNCISRNN